MAAQSKRKALAEARRAQGKLEKTQGLVDRDRLARKESFERAKDVGASLREIADAAGLHWTRVREIISGR